MDTRPFGYGTARLTLDEMEGRQTVYNLDAEFWRRFRALSDAAAAANVDVGVGTGWRVQPNPPPAGFAAPGNSHHESMPVKPASATAFAIDMVGSAGYDVWVDENALRFGLRTFRRIPTKVKGVYKPGVSNPGYTGTPEGWHIQPSEIPNARSYRTTPYVLSRFRLPGDAPPVPTPPPVQEDEDMPLTFQDPRDQSLWVIASDLGHKMWVEQSTHDVLVETGLYKWADIDVALLDRIPDARTLVPPQGAG